MVIERKRALVLGVSIDVLTWDDAVGRLLAWAQGHESRYVCICNVHSVVTARQDVAFGSVIREADMATPDGAPVAWMLRSMGFIEQARINGPDLMWRVCEVVAQPPAQDEAVAIHGIQTTEQVCHAPAGYAMLEEGAPSIYLYGGSEDTLAILQNRLIASFPGLKIAGAYSPPFRPLSETEDAAVVEQINASGAGLVWVSLGCPKQEKWMAAHRGRIQAVMVGVGAAFDYHAGTIKRAPLWMQHSGLEWLHRLASEPRRLWRRYLLTNTLFMLGAIRQLILKK